MAGKGLLTLEELRSRTADGSIDTVVVCFPDMQGRLIGKRFEANFFVESGYKETHACDYLLANDIDMEPVPGYAAANWGKGYGDFVLLPDMDTLRVTPWLEGTALVLCDVVDHQDHNPLPHAPRSILKAQLERLNNAGMTAFAASELEFYLFDEDYRSLRDRRYHKPLTAGDYIEDYHVFQTTKEEPVLRAMRNGLQEAGIPVECSKGEWGPGQEELNVRYSEALVMADRHVIMKNAMKEIAFAHDKSITFMAKWNHEMAGNSAHIHMSLWDADGRDPLFYNEFADHGMSQTMRKFVAGQLKYAADYTAFLAPYINSYKRFQEGTFAPTKLVWSRDNRTAAFRLCGESSKAIRIECRVGGADLNPYLAYASLIAAGLQGLEEELELPPAHEGDAYVGKRLRSLPTTLAGATQTLTKSKMLRHAFGNAVVDHYVRAAEWEISESNRKVTDWDLMRGFERY